MGQKLVYLQHIRCQFFHRSGQQRQAPQCPQFIAGAVLPARCFETLVHPQDLVTFLLGTPLPQRQHMAERLGILPRAKRVFQRVVAGLHLIHHRLLCIGGQGQQNRKHTVLRPGEKGVLPLHPPVNLLRPGGHPIQVPSPRPICQQQGGQYYDADYEVVDDDKDKK